VVADWILRSFQDSKMENNYILSKFEFSLITSFKNLIFDTIGSPAMRGFWPFWAAFMLFLDMVFASFCVKVH
jgi:hypothetical protein